MNASRLQRRKYAPSYGKYAIKMFVERDLKRCLILQYVNQPNPPDRKDPRPSTLIRLPHPSDC
jgi:hypothetical protein